MKNITLFLLLLFSYSSSVFANSYDQAYKEYEKAYKVYQQLAVESRALGLEQNNLVHKLDKLNAQSLVKSFGMAQAANTLSAQTAKLQAQSRLIEEAVRLRSVKNLTYLHLFERPRVVGTKLIKAVAPFSVVAAALGYSGANAAEASMLEKNSTGGILSQDTAFRTNLKFSTDTLGATSFSETESQK